jgi:hypothetical protein
VRIGSQAAFGHSIPHSSQLSQGMSARRLERHGTNRYTPKSCPGCTADKELASKAILCDVIDRRARADAAQDWKVLWRIHQCTEDPGCICGEMLLAAP